MDIAVIASEKTAELCEQLHLGQNVLYWTLDYKQYSLSEETIASIIRDTYYEEMTFYEHDVTEITCDISVNDFEMCIFYYATVE